MGAKDNYIKINCATVVLAILLMIVVSANVSLYMINDRDRSEIKMSDLKGSSAAMGICTASVDSWFYICDNPEQDIEWWGHPIYDMTQEQMDSILENCPDGKFIDTAECIGDRLTVYYPD